MKESSSRVESVRGWEKRRQRRGMTVTRKRSGTKENGGFLLKYRESWLLTSGQRSWRVCVLPRKRLRVPVRCSRFAHTQDFGGESLKTGDQDAIGRSESSVWARPIVARADNGGGSSLRSASSRRSAFGTLYQAGYISANLYRPLVRSSIWIDHLLFSAREISSRLDRVNPEIVCHSSSLYRHFQLLTASFSVFFRTSVRPNCFSLPAISGVYETSGKRCSN